MNRIERTPARLTKRELPTASRPHQVGPVENPSEHDHHALQDVHLSQGQRVADLEDKQRNLVTRLFVERGLAKAVEKNRVEEVKNWHQFRSDMFRLAADTKLENCHEACLLMTRELKVTNRNHFSSFVTAKEEELRQTIKQRLETFLAEVDRSYELLERYQHRPYLAARYEQMIETSIDRYSDFLDGLMDNFISIARERVNEYRITD